MFGPCRRELAIQNQLLMSPVPTLIGSYAPPAVRKGDRVLCLYRDAECVVTSWSDGRIAWPRVRALGQRGGSGLLIDETLRRAVQTESAIGLKFWFGVGARAVWRWRKAFQISRTGTEGSRRLHQAASERGAEGIKSKVWTAAERALKRALTRGRKPHGRWEGRRWTTEMDARLGAEEDDALAREWGKTTGAVRVRRARLGIPSALDHRKRQPREQGA